MQSTCGEHWLPIAGRNGWYEVSDLGRVRSVDRTIMRSNGVPQRRKGKVLSFSRSWYGHLRVELPGGYAYVHRLVLETFLGSAPDGMEACHNNGDPTDNRLANLRWADHTSNVMDSIDHGTHSQARKTRCKHGHEFTPENTYHRRGGGRMCKTCVRMRKKRYRSPGYRKVANSHCVRGHEYTEENTYRRKGGGRMCRTCMANSRRRRYAERTSK